MSTYARFAALFFVLAAALVAARAAAQPFCSRGWVGQPNGLPDGTVLATATWDPDGSGPLGPVLVVGGSFYQAADVAAANVAYWDGTAWHQLSFGLNNTVRAPAVFNGTLYAGGDFTGTGANTLHYFAKWNGSAWVDAILGTDGRVNVLTVDGNGLLVGGAFTHAAGGLLPFARLARFTGTGWDGYEKDPSTEVVAVQVLNGQPVVMEIGNQCGGVVPHPTNFIQVYDGTRWITVECEVYWNGGFIVYDGALFYSSLRPAHTYGSTNEACKNFSEYAIVRYDGTSRTTSKAYHGAASFVEHNGLLYAIGFRRAICPFTAEVPHQYAEWLGSFNGTTWTDLFSLHPRVEGILASYNGSLLVAGNFDVVAGQVEASSIAQLIGSTWEPLAPGFDATARSATLQGATLYVGGDFTRPGSSVSGRVSKFNGSYWEGIGATCDAPVTLVASHAYNPLAFNSKLIIAGDFTHVGATPYAHIVQRDSADLSYTALGTGLDGAARAALSLVTSFSHADLILGGDFTLAGGVSAQHIARWTGGAWVTNPFGSGMNGSVLALANYSGIVAGGTFSLAGGVAQGNIARWDGAAWQPLGAGLNGAVRALAIFNGSLIATGDFTASGATPLAHIAAWNGTAWSPLGVGLDGNGASLAAAGLTLFAGGSFTHAGGAAANHVGEWDGSAWRQVGLAAAPGGGVDGEVLGLAIGTGDLVAVGSFTHAGLQKSVYVARAAGAGDFGIAKDPESTSTCPGGIATFSATASSGASFITVEYKWYRDGFPLTDGVSPSGTAFYGSDTPLLELSNVAPADAVGYWCKATSGCGQTATTHTATLDVGGPTCCLADLTHDGTVDLLDFFQFFNCFDATDPCADLDGNPGVDLNDFFAFFNAWANGC